MNHSLALFLQFFRRDLYIYSKRSSKYFVNYVLIYPALFAFAFLYVVPAIFFGAGNEHLGTVIFIGHSLIMIIPLAFNLMIGLLFDLENERYIDYQLTLLNPRILILERIFFTATFIFCMTLPFFPIAKLLLPQSFDTASISWPAVLLVLYAGALCSAAYLQCMVCLIPNTRTLRRFWMRVNFMLITFGGLFAPWYIIASFSKPVSYLSLLNPLLYITEGLRRAILGDANFIPVPVCIAALLFFTALLTIASFYFFKKRVDHI